MISFSLRSNVPAVMYSISFDTENIRKGSFMAFFLAPVTSSTFFEVVSNEAS